MHLNRVGLQKTTLIDYPGLVASTIFTAGCNLRCPYCHNPELVNQGIPGSFISTKDFFGFLAKRKNVLGGVCITGGEPLIYDNLPEIIKQIQGFGLKVKLDTNGTFPDKLKTLSPDYIAMDLKTTPQKYHLVTETSPETKDTTPLAEKIKTSLEYLKTSGIDFEIRTTWVPGIVDLEDIPEIARLLEGVEKYFVTPFRGGVTLDPEWNGRPSPASETMEKIKNIFKDYSIPVRIRA